MYRRLLPFLTLAFGLGALVGHGLRPREPLPRTPQEAAVRLAERGLRFQLVSLPCQGDPSTHSQRAFLTTTDKTAAELLPLPWSPAASYEWQGTVFCERVVPRDGPAYGDPAHQRRVGDLLFYGDPNLLCEVTQLLR
jgi:hypothetical protein